MRTDKQVNGRVVWQKLVEDHAKSGLTQKAFCAQQNVSLVKFSYYRKLFRPSTPSSAQKLLAPVHLKSRVSAVSTDIRIILPNGFQCVTSSAVDVTQVKQLLTVLLSC